MKRTIKMPSIDQFRNTVHTILHTARYIGTDEDDVAQFDKNIKLPVINAIGTEKIHGTNASVCYSEPDGFWVQSKKNIITPQKDNASCAFYAEQNKEQWIEIINSLADEYEINLAENIITVYYEWCGAGIQKRTAVDGLEKRAMIFRHFKVSPLETGTETPAMWLETKVQEKWIDDTEKDIFNINNFKTYEFEIDFNNPLMIQNTFIETVEKNIEPSSPVGESFGIKDNIGEGLVISFMFRDNLYMFKVKGDKHSKSKVKKLKPVDTAKLQKIQDIAHKVTPAWRLEQMYEEANDIINNGTPKMENMRKYLDLVKADILKEDSDIIADAGLTPKDIFGDVSRISALHFKELFNKF